MTTRKLRPGPCRWFVSRHAGMLLGSTTTCYFWFDCVRTTDDAPTVKVVSAIGNHVIVSCSGEDGSPVDVIGAGWGSSSEGNQRLGYTATVTVTGPVGEKRNRTLLLVGHNGKT